MFSAGSKEERAITDLLVLCRYAQLHLLQATSSFQPFTADGGALKLASCIITAKLIAFLLDCFAVLTSGTLKRVKMCCDALLIHTKAVEEII